jgi:S-adenosylmethionine:tRNA ribosyltransferase-isomerase
LAKRVIAVGTTATRALESAATTGVLTGRTNMFISQGYEFKIVDLLLTNFHMPRTTLLMLVDAFIGPRWKSLYEVAIQEKYRMLSFGDAMLLDRKL